ncbi:hypothetical protein CC80DRAFT_491515 [Byssothecium circinans]|uniref:Uncharacterized protein n=1 Tax=Byssothecium circinans TaxID=147558 RepID=A0A6A5U8F4_9PLEO|nr:hypothetical protein CC80DRAFT_491515 [Byssothecium circinans]
MGPLPSQRPCTNPLDWNLHANNEGETYIPFQDYVRPEQTNQLDVSFPQFLQLPTELQLRIIRFCNSATLFQLMHVSSATRDEARKLFWSDPGSRYFVHGGWLQAGGSSGHTLHAVEALACMKHVEVEFYCEGPFAHDKWDYDEGRWATADVPERQADAFWQIFQRCLPSATNVVLKVRAPMDAGEAAPADLTMLAERCPAGIRVSTSRLQKEAGCRFLLRKSLWQQVWHDCSQPATWEVVDISADTTQSVLPPAKTFRGPVGAFYRHDYNVERLFYLYNAQSLLLIQAIEVYYTQNPQAPIVCPVSKCGSRFETPRAWALHASDAYHLKLKLPNETLDMLFSEHDARLERMNQEITDNETRMRLEWGEEGSEQRRKREEDFLHQLQHDPEYAHAKPPRESAIWRRYQVEMNTEMTAE